MVWIPYFCHYLSIFFRFYPCISLWNIWSELSQNMNSIFIQCLHKCFHLWSIPHSLHYIWDHRKQVFFWGDIPYATWEKDNSNLYYVYLHYISIHSAVKFIYGTFQWLHLAFVCGKTKPSTVWSRYPRKGMTRWKNLCCAWDLLRVNKIPTFTSRLGMENQWYSYYT